MGNKTLNEILDECGASDDGAVKRRADALMRKMLGLDDSKSGSGGAGRDTLFRTEVHPLLGGGIGRMEWPIAQSSGYPNDPLQYPNRAHYRGDRFSCYHLAKDAGFGTNCLIAQVRMWRELYGRWPRYVCMTTTFAERVGRENGCTVANGSRVELRWSREDEGSLTVDVTAWGGYEPITGDAVMPYIYIPAPWIQEHEPKKIAKMAIDANFLSREAVYG